MEEIHFAEFMGDVGSRSGTGPRGAACLPGAVPPSFTSPGVRSCSQSAAPNGGGWDGAGPVPPHPWVLLCPHWPCWSPAALGPTGPGGLSLVCKSLPGRSRAWWKCHLHTGTLLTIILLQTKAIYSACNKAGVITKLGRAVTGGRVAERASPSPCWLAGWPGRWGWQRRGSRHHHSCQRVAGRMGQWHIVW